MSFIIFLLEMWYDYIKYHVDRKVELGVTSYCGVCYMGIDLDAVFL
jgi:hypothetical protein